ncbi:hypothetical protein Tco_0390847 [Tanacetum coccineum]
MLALESLICSYHIVRPRHRIRNIISHCLACEFHHVLEAVSHRLTGALLHLFPLCNTYAELRPPSSKPLGQCVHSFLHQFPEYGYRPPFRVAALAAKTALHPRRSCPVSLALVTEGLCSSSVTGVEFVVTGGGVVTITILSYLDDSLPELETFSFDVEEKNNGSTTTHADISLPKNDSFHFDLSDTSLHLANKSNSVFEKFDNELAHIIPPPEYDCFYFDIEPDPGDLTTDMMKNISDNSTREEPRVHIPNVLPTLPTLYLDLDFTLSYDFSGLNLVASFPFGKWKQDFRSGNIY